MKKTIEIKVKANSPESKIVENNNSIIVHVRAKPEKNKANAEIIKLFSKRYKNVRIIRGMKGSKKLLSLEV